MIYNQYPYNIFNQDSLQDVLNQQEAVRQQMLQKAYHAEQQENIAKMVKAIQDFFEASRKVSLEYRDLASAVCLAEVIEEAKRNNGI